MQASWSLCECKAKPDFCLSAGHKFLDRSGSVGRAGCKADCPIRGSVTGKRLGSWEPRAKLSRGVFSPLHCPPSAPNSHLCDHLVNHINVQTELWFPNRGKANGTPSYPASEVCDRVALVPRLHVSTNAFEDISVYGLLNSVTMKTWPNCFHIGTYYLGEPKSVFPSHVHSYSAPE